MLKLALKDLKLFVSEKRGLLLTFLLPIALITMFSLAFGGSGKKGESRPMTLVVADDDRTAESRRVAQELDSLKEFEVQVTSLDTGMNMVKKGDKAAILVLHKGLEDSVKAGASPPIEFMYDAAREAEIGILQGSLMGSLMGIVGMGSMEKSVVERFKKKNPDLDSAQLENIRQQIKENFSPEASEEQMEESQSFIKSTALVAEEETSPGLVQAVAGTAIMMLLFSVTSMGASLLDEKQEGTLKKLLYSPISPGSILTGKMLFTNIVCILQLTVMFLYSWLVFGLNIAQNIPALILMIIATAYACSSFGMFLAAVARTRAQVQGMSTLIILVMSCLGGSMIPSFLMPLWMQKVAVISVNYWGIQGFYDIFWRMLPVGDPTFLTRVLVLMAIGTGLNLVAMRLMKRNLLAIA